MSHEASEYGLFTYDSNGYQDITIKVGSLTASASPGDWVELKMTSQEAKFNDSYMNSTALQAVPSGHQDEGWALYRIYGVHPSNGTAVYVYLSDPEQSTGQLRVETYDSGLTQMISDSGILNFERKISPTQSLGYYPLFTTEEDANNFSPVGTSHSHELNYTTYYMPNGLSLGNDQFHGDLYSAGFYELEGNDPGDFYLYNPNYVTEAGRSGARFTPGTDTFARVAHFSADDAVYSGSFTISMWIRTTQTTETVLWYKDMGTLMTDGTMTLKMNHPNASSAGRITFEMFGENSDWTEVHSSNSIVNDGNWHRVSVTVSRAQYNRYVQIHIDGSSDGYASISEGDGEYAGNGWLWLGRFPDGSKEFDGVIDTFKIYSQPLSDAYSYYNTEWINDPANVPSIDQASADNVGDTLTVSFPGDTPTLDSFYFQRWNEESSYWEQISGTSGTTVSSYTIVTTDSQKTIRAVASISGRNYYSQQIAVADFRNPAYVPSINVPSPTVLGDTLTVSYDNAANITSFSFQRWSNSSSYWETIWSTSGSAVVDYTLTGVDSEQELRVVMTIDGLIYTSLNASIPDLRDPNMNPSINSGPFSLGDELSVTHEFADPITQFTFERSFDGEYWVEKETSHSGVITRALDYTDNLSTYRAKFVVNSMTYYTDSITIGDLSVNIVPTYKFGYGPIFLTDDEAILYPGSNGTVTTYTLGGTVYYMPNGLDQFYTGQYGLINHWDMDGSSSDSVGLVGSSVQNGPVEFVDDSGRNALRYGVTGDELIGLYSPVGFDQWGDGEWSVISPAYDGSGWTVSLWFKGMRDPALNDGGTSTILAYDVAGVGHFELANISGGELGLFDGVQKSSGFVMNHADYQGWHMLTVSFDVNAGTAKFFIDGASVGSPVAWSGQNLINQIGGLSHLDGGTWSTETRAFAEMIDDVRVWINTLASDEVDYWFNETEVLDPNYVVTLTVRMQDSYGDGWNGGNFAIRDYDTNFALDGGVFTGPASSDGTSWIDVPFTVPAGTDYRWTTVSGSYPSEGRVIVLDQAGVELLNLTTLASSSGTFSVGEPPPPDTIAPAVTLNGDATVLILNGGTYTELGATALDNNDGDLTDNIIIMNSPDVNVDGTYNVTYKAVDAAGNEGFAYRTVHVKTFAQISNDDTSLPQPSSDSGWTNGDTPGVVARTGITEYTITPFGSGPFNAYLVSGNESSTGPKVIQEKVYGSLPAHTYLKFGFDLYTMHGSRNVEVYVDNNLVYTLNAADMIQVDDITGGQITVPFEHSNQFKGSVEFITPHVGDSATIRFEIVNDAFTKYAFTPMVIELDSASVHPQLTYGITGGAGHDGVMLMVFLNGKLVHPSSYTVVGEQITFNEGILSVGDEIYCVRAG